MRKLAVLAVTLLSPQSPAPAWIPQPSGVEARLRGVSAPSADVVWASGSEGTVIRTEDGGKTWRRLQVPDSEKLDFRDIDGVDAKSAYVLSIGPGDASRIYKTTDAGATWTLQFRNADPKAFFDAMAFCDAQRGFAFSDSVEGRFIVLRTDNGGARWTLLPSTPMPPAFEGEGAYAASGTNVVCRGERIWIGTTAGRVLRSEDGGRTWAAVQTPIATGPSAGIFSIAFRSDTHGVVVGGDYKNEGGAVDNAAVTSDGGRTWTLARGLGGYRSAVAYVPSLDRTLVATGPSGSDISTDDGRTWTPIPGPGFHALAFAPGAVVGWGVGEKGALAKVELRRF